MGPEARSPEGSDHSLSPMMEYFSFTCSRYIATLSGDSVFLGLCYVFSYGSLDPLSVLGSFRSRDPELLECSSESLVPLSTVTMWHSLLSLVFSKDNKDVPGLTPVN